MSRISVDEKSRGKEGKIRKNLSRNRNNCGSTRTFINGGKKFFDLEKDSLAEIGLSQVLKERASEFPINMQLIEKGFKNNLDFYSDTSINSFRDSREVTPSNPDVNSFRDSGGVSPSNPDVKMPELENIIVIEETIKNNLDLNDDASIKTTELKNNFIKIECFVDTPEEATNQKHQRNYFPIENTIYKINLHKYGLVEMKIFSNTLISYPKKCLFKIKKSELFFLIKSEKGVTLNCDGFIAKKDTLIRCGGKKTGFV